MAHGKILLLDSNALIHRSYHALPPLSTPHGEQVNAVYGFTHALLKAIKDEKPDYVVACFDVGKATFRTEIYDGYKAHRQETDEALKAQIPRVREIVEVLNIPIYGQKGVEADDLIGSLATIAAKDGLQVVIVTGDNDALQLVNDSVSVYSLRRGVTDTLSYNRQTVKEKIGVFPEQIVDYKALAGDSSDNIPGAPGIGPKTAIELLTKYHDLNEIYDHTDELKDRTRQILTEYKDQVMMSQRLAQIRQDLTIDLDLDKADIGNFRFNDVVRLFQELDFKSLLSKLPSQQPTVGNRQSAFDFSARADSRKPIAPAEPVFQLPFEAITDLKRWHEIKPILLAQTELVIDTETVDFGQELIGVAFAWQGQQPAISNQLSAKAESRSPIADSSVQSAYLPLKPHPEGLAFDKELRADLRAVLENSQIRKIGHNLKYDLHALYKSGLEVKNVWFDTMIASQLCNSQAYSHGLDALAFAEFGFKKVATTTILGGKKDGKMTDVPLPTLAAYACEDVLVTRRLFEKFRKLVEEPGIKRVFYEIEMPLLPILRQMESTGVKIDRSYLGDLGQKLTRRLKKIEADAANHLGTDVNIASPAQLQDALFNKLKLSVVGIKKIKSGYSTDADSLLKLRDAHPVIALILEYRELAKLLNTYIDTLPLTLDASGRVHTSFMQIGAASGRVASTNPNLQNIPIRTELGNEVRRAFVADKGKVLLGADYSQAELRVLAHLCDDPGLIAAFHNGDDFHKQVAERLMVDRRSAKAINFGIIYGQGPVALAEDLGITTSAAKDFIDKYFATFPGVMTFITKMKQIARDEGYVETLFGRRRYLPDIHSPNPMMRAAAERIAVNHPCQGCLPAQTKVLTNSGYMPIGTLYQLSKKRPAKVWDGTNWQTYEVLDRGLAELAELHFSNGQVLKCDTRHKVLAVNDKGYYWADYNSLKIGDKVCFSLPIASENYNPKKIGFNYSKKVHNSNDLSFSSLPNELWYWLGYYYGDGHLTVGLNTNRYSLQYSFGGKETAKRLACQRFFQSLGFAPKIREMSYQIASTGKVGVKESVEIYSRPCVELFQLLGVHPNENAHTKRLPQLLFQQSLDNRRNFVRGFMGADGYISNDTDTVPVVHLCQRDMLEDFQLLLRSIGVESHIGKPSIGRYTSYRLFIKRRQLADIIPDRIVKAKYTTENNYLLPAFIRELVKKIYPSLPKKHFKTASDYVIYRRILDGGSSSIYHFIEWLKRNDLILPTPLYTWHEVIKKKELGIYDTTYTLAVNAGSHRFDSEGVISKNTVADLMKLSMIEVADKLPQGANMTLQIHDELLFEIDHGLEEKVATIVKDVMVNVIKLKVPLEVDVKTGPNWADLQHHPKYA